MGRPKRARGIYVMVGFGGEMREEIFEFGDVSLVLIFMEGGIGFCFFSRFQFWI